MNLKEKYEEVEKKWGDSSIIEKYKAQERIIEEIFRKTDDAYLQVCLLNHLYSTNLEMKNDGGGGEFIMSKILDEEKIKDKIWESKDKCDAKKIISLVCKKFHEKTNKNAYSFATKYCFHLFESIYPKRIGNPFIIVDRIVLKQLEGMQKQIDYKIEKNDLNRLGRIKILNKNSLGEAWNYELYYDLMFGLQTKINEQMKEKTLSLRDIELFLWKRGKLKIN